MGTQLCSSVHSVCSCFWAAIAELVILTETDGSQSPKALLPSAWQRRWLNLSSRISPTCYQMWPRYEVIDRVSLDSRNSSIVLPTAWPSCPCSFICKKAGFLNDLMTFTCLPRGHLPLWFSLSHRIGANLLPSENISQCQARVHAVSGNQIQSGDRCPLNPSSACEVGPFSWAPSSAKAHLEEKGELLLFVAAISHCGLRSWIWGLASMHEIIWHCRFDTDVQMFLPNPKPVIRPPINLRKCLFPEIGNWTAGRLDSQHSSLFLATHLNDLHCTNVLFLVLCLCSWLSFAHLIVFYSCGNFSASFI